MNRRDREEKVPNRLKSSITEARGLSALPSQPLSPIEYQFLLRRASAVSEELIEDAVLSIGSASTTVGFQEAVLNALHLILFSVRYSMVFLLNSDSEELEWCKSESENFPLPKSGVLWEAVRGRSASILKAGEVVHENDPMRDLIPDFKFIEPDQVLLINPIVEKKHHEVIALMMVVCNDPSVSQVDKLRWVEKNVVVAASRVLKQVSIEKDCNRSVGMLNVCSELIDLDTTSLSIKILKHIKSTLDVKMCALFLVSEGTQELVCPAVNELPLEKEIRIELTSQNIYGRCFLTREVLVLDNVSKDLRFNPVVDKINNYDPGAMMCLPINVLKKGDSVQQTVGVALVCDKTNGKPFTARDEENMAFMLRFSSSVIANTLAYQRELTLKKQNQALLLMARNLFSQLSNLSTLLKEIMNEARSLTNAERCSLFLLDRANQDLVAAVFDSDLATEKDTIRIKVGQGIAGLVAQSGKFVNIRDAYKHPQFFCKMDQNTGFRTRNLLCFPIKDHQGAVVGVAQLCNKIGANFFSLYDEELATTFSVYCGISLYQSQLYKKMEESQGRSQLATELMIYHMQVISEDVEQLAVSPIPSCSSFNEKFSTFSYSPRSLPEADTVLTVMSMMTEMDLIKRWKIERNTLAKFLLMVKKGYRDQPYHNWFHAVSVAHFCYVLHCLCDGFECLSEVESLALFIACLCHDIDHRGTNNAFQVSSNSTLASLYSSEGSVMERHHFAQTVCILNSQGCNIFENIPHALYREVLDLIQHDVLSTDIAHHLHLKKGFEEMAAVGYQKSNKEHHKMMCSLVMTSCDLSGTCKEWKWSKHISDLIYTEFFTQGDLERALGNTPIEMMDRNKAFVPDQQLGFINGIAGPAYKFLAHFLPGAAPAYEDLGENKKIWEKLAKEGKQGSEQSQS